METRDKVVVVTGAASGIGAGLAQRFAREGARAVVLADVNLERAQGVAQGIGPQAIALACDVSREADIQALAHETRARFGRIDVWCSNAGIIGRLGGVELEDALWQKMWEIHGMAHVWAARAVMPEMAERGEGYFLVTASAAGLLNIVESPAYAATKHAAVGIAEWLRIAYGRKGVRVSCLCPQSVQTDMTGDGTGSAGINGVLTPDEVAEVVVQTMREERFLALPHPEVATYLRNKAQDYDRWLGGMQKLYSLHTKPPAA
jgi:NAD(P)-dependent dehydrogenase (short-subunit alcohol dehydrogenase family)